MALSKRTPSRYSLANRLRRFLFRRRRLLAMLLMCAAAGLTVQQLIPADGQRTLAVVAGTDLPAGVVLNASHLTVDEVPTGSAVATAFADPEELIGEQLATPLVKGSTVESTSLVGPGLLTGTAPGTVAVPVRPADPSVLELLAPGQLVDVVHSTGNGYEVDSTNTVIANHVAVLWVAGDQSSAGAWPQSSGSAGGLVVIAATPEQSTALAGASSSGKVHLVLTSATD
ncbi:Flp pilus assembly protein CpaB [Arthrobacter roseus]|uniref:Flp pilus assembly protein CpaB n=1 Tax=Arthrobacter roseus TaxID=136274 RepID=UPI001966170A|nr:Flp pilus assembly protein CpaB [Arthrobacter roseus]MBM7849237.1 Flp pilus assembly protein CpaB [Arthrobacter roseus]